MAVFGCEVSPSQVKGPWLSSKSSRAAAAPLAAASDRHDGGGTQDFGGCMACLLAPPQGQGLHGGPGDLSLLGPPQAGDPPRRVRPPCAVSYVPHELLRQTVRDAGIAFLCQA
jgi:hypothetical protein